MLLLECRIVIYQIDNKHNIDILTANVYFYSVHFHNIEYMKNNCPLQYLHLLLSPTQSNLI